MAIMTSLASFIITLLLAAAVCTHGEESVRDSNGNEVRLDEQYYIQPISTWSNGGGLAPLAGLNPFCEPRSITEALAGEAGVPVSIAYPPKFITSLQVVKTNISITIEFKSNDDCKDLSMFWQVYDARYVIEPPILTGGRPEKLNSRFKIEKVGEKDGTNIYKLTTSAGTVGGIPVLGAKPHRVLLLTNDVANIIYVKFIKINDVSSTSRVEKLGLRMIPFY
ncbi:Kunitz family trypsin and protease inhibitor protein [Raphanus sativus]|uniref:Kunitz trypsin inhibitor 2-like n=1 Tax=Raphanus sativus TaxID=3726 RepID=A0A6J0L7A0_RAPSA|nr:kunitz trypsin inhibitor 2-like [Raphanus sativus]KAJ4874934.1 Kunitz family trypsin and protease inhibitor protein [Raphanus sativus]